MSNKVYDVLKVIGTIVIPAVGTLYAALANAQGQPYSEAVVATCAAIAAFIGTILKISSDAYAKASAENK